MTNTQKLTRDEVIKTLVDVLRPLEFVHAFWEGGAAAFHRIDEWSDLDLYLVVDDTKTDETFAAVEKVLGSLSPVNCKYEVSHPPQSGLYQAFYRLEQANEYLLIDLAVLKSSSPDKFLEPEIHGNVVFYFNKSDLIRAYPVDRDALIRKLCEKSKKLRTRFTMFSNFVQKEINRGNHLEAIDLYHNLILAGLVEALRIRSDPFHHNFKTRYIHYELPLEFVKKLKQLYFVKDEKDLQTKYREAVEWFEKTMLKINQKEIERLVRAIDPDPSSPPKCARHKNDIQSQN